MEWRRMTRLEIAGVDRQTPVVVPLAAVAARAVDSRGAGDAFNVGFIYGWLRGCPASECARLAARGAAMSAPYNSGGGWVVADWVTFVSALSHRDPFNWTAQPWLRPTEYLRRRRRRRFNCRGARAIPRIARRGVSWRRGVRATTGRFAGIG